MYKRQKYDSREHSHFVQFASPETPWSLKFESNLRKNKVDKDSSRFFLANEALTSVKHSASMAYFKMKETSMTSVSMELALPFSDSRCASFLKLETKHQQKWPLVRDKLNLVLDLQGGIISGSPFGQRKTFVNDRFYLHNTSGYLALGHEEPSNMH